MPNLSVNKSISLTIPAGNVLKIFNGGQGIATLSTSKTPIDVGYGGTVIGTFSYDVTVSLLCTSGAFNYYVGHNIDWKPEQSADDPPAYLSTDSSGNVNGLVGYKGYRNTRKSNIGTRIFGGRMGTFDNTTTQTFQVTCTLAQHFDAVRVIFANSSNASTVAVGSCKVSSQSSASDLNNSAGTWAAVNFSGSGAGTIPLAASAGSRRGYLISDWTSLSSADRSDSGTFPLLTIRANITTAGVISVLGNGTDNFTNWASRPSGRILAMRKQAGDQVTTTSGFNSVTNVSQSPIIGVQYAARGQVITVMGAGDSITEGRGTYIGEGFGVKACESISSMSGVAVEWSNIGWSGTATSVHNDQIIDIINAGIKPDLMLLSYGSPNEITVPWTSSNSIAIRQKLCPALSVLREAQIPIILWTVLPTNPAVKNYGSSDLLRVAHNNATLDYNNKGMEVLDFASVLSGITDGNGQVNMLAGSTTDGIHPNDTGNALLAPVLANKIKEYF